MTSRFTGMLCSTLALLVAGGCGGGSSSAEAVAWTDEVCGALAGFTRAATTRPDVDRTDPVATVRGYSDYFGSAAAGIDTAITRLESAGASPLDGGDEYVTRLKDALAQIRASFNTARTQLAEVDTSSVESVTTAIPSATAPLRELSNLADPTAGLRANDELQAAAEEAPNCQALRSTG